VTTFITTDLGYLHKVNQKNYSFISDYSQNMMYTGSHCIYIFTYYYN